MAATASRACYAVSTIGIRKLTKPPSSRRFIRTASFHGGRTTGAWDYNASVTWIDAERQGSTINPTLNGLRPTNVPRWVLRSDVSRTIEAVPGLKASAHLSHEGRRAITPNNQLQLGSWTRVDAALRYDTRVQGRPANWVVAVDNLFDRRYFQEAPFQYEHIYLFPAASRTLRVAFETQF